MAGSWAGTRARGSAQEAAMHGGRCNYRDVCGRGNNVHAEYKNKHGETMQTDHYSWPTRRRSR